MEDLGKPMTADQYIRHEGELLGLIVSAQPYPEATTFYTPDTLTLQCGRVVWGAGSEIARHRHEPVNRDVVGTPEVLIIEKGRVIVDLYAADGSYACNRTLSQGDIIILVAGGHGFRVIDDAVLLEVKQGPYLGFEDKRFF